jgi:hypothetical protein
MTNRQARSRWGWVLALYLVLAVFALSACDVVDAVAGFFPESSVGALQSDAGKPGTVQIALPTVDPTQVPIDFDVITVWIEPQFDPDADNPAAQLLKSHLQDYLSDHPGAKVEFRLKASAGANAILNALSVTAAAAPDALPTIVLLSRDDMEAAAALGLIRPLDFYVNAMENNDWYPFANKMGKYHNEVFGLPFAADVMVLVLQNEMLQQDYLPFTQIPRQFGPIAFAAGESQPLVPYLWYQSAGGEVFDDQDQPTLEEEAVSALFSAVAGNRQAGILTSSLSQYKSDTELWNKYLDGELNALITWSSHVRAAPTDYPFTFVPALGSVPYTYADGWVWCLVQKATTDIELNLDLMQHLVSADFLKDWTERSDLLPVRPSSISSFGDQQGFIDQLLLSADLIPPVEMRRSYGAFLSEEINALLLGVKSAEASTQDLLIRLEENDQDE